MQACFPRAAVICAASGDYDTTALVRQTQGKSSAAG